MITQQEIEINSILYLRTASDKYQIRQIETGAIYDEAIDSIPCLYTYEETDEPLQQPEPEPEQKLNYE